MIGPLEEFKLIPMTKEGVRFMITMDSKAYYVVSKYDAFSAYRDEDTYKVAETISNLGCEVRVGTDGAGDLQVTVTSIPEGYCLLAPKFDPYNYI